MKYVYTLVFVLFCLASNAQLDFRLNVDDLLKKKVALNIELGADKFSLELGNRFLLGPWSSIGYLDQLGNLTDELVIKRFGYVGTLRANYYLKPNTSLDGFHISPTIDYMRQKVKFNDPTINNRVGASVLIGYKYLFRDSKFSAQIETGAGYWFVDKTNFKISGLIPEGEEFLNEVSGGLGFLKGLRALRLPLNITVNYRIGGE